MALKDPEKQRAYYAKWLAKNRDKNNLVRRTRYKHDPVYRTRAKELSAQSRARSKAKATNATPAGEHSND
jgi:hypothetical protein